jgi:hypothetical protein
MRWSNGAVSFLTLFWSFCVLYVGEMAKSSMISRFIAFILVVSVLAYLTARQKFRARISRITPEHLYIGKVRNGMATLSADVISQAWSKNTNLTTYTQFWQAVQKDFPDLSINPSSTNPFPDWLPTGNYQFARKFPFESPSDSPFMWIVVTNQNIRSVFLTTLDGGYDYDFTNRLGSSP